MASDLLWNSISSVRKIFKAVRTVYFFRMWYTRKEQFFFFFPLGSETAILKMGDWTVSGFTNEKGRILIEPAHFCFL